MKSETIPVVDREPRCWRCGKKLAVLLTRPWEIACVRCGARNATPQPEGHPRCCILRSNADEQRHGDGPN